MHVWMLSLCREWSEWGYVQNGRAVSQKATSEIAKYLILIQDTYNLCEEFETMATECNYFTAWRFTELKNCVFFKQLESFILTSVTPITLLKSTQNILINISQFKQAMNNI